MREIWQSRQIPGDWRNGVILPIDKKGKEMSYSNNTCSEISNWET
jgi:hypothetical protein